VVSYVSALTITDVYPAITIHGAAHHQLVLENTLSILCHNVLIGTVEVMLIEPLLIVMLGLKYVTQFHWSVGSAVLRENELMAISKNQVYFFGTVLEATNTLGF
jgi:hypothetical protein